MKSIILVAFYFKPYKGVSSFRISYWYDRLKEDSFNVKVLTGTPNDMDNDYDANIHRLLLKSDKPFPFIKDLSLAWGFKAKKIIDKWLTENQEQILLITGSPFLHFGSLIKLKNKYPKSKWILDYRDPLARNPRLLSSSVLGKIKDKYKEIYEKKLNQKADLLLVVNKVCQECLVGGENKNVVIENGYDERAFKIHELDEKEDRIVYAGKLYNETALPTLSKASESIKGPLVYHVGAPHSYTQDIPNLIACERLDYQSTIKILCKSTIGVVITNGEAFQSTTKIFDYFAAKLKILIITNGKPKTGNLQTITQNNPNVEWASNNVEDIKNALIKLNRPYKEWDYEDYSRDFGYKILKDLLKNF